MKLTTTNLSVSATKLPVLENVNLAVEPGKTLVILGPNGSGKSTLLRTLCRQLAPLAGSVSLDNKYISLMSADEFARKVAFVPQSIDPDIQLTIEDYVALGRSPHQKWWQWQQTDSDRSIVENVLEATELLDLRKRSLSQLSGGERQRTAIAIALAQKPQFLLLDEPTAHLDFKHQTELIKLLVTLKQDLGLVVVLHDLTTAALLADEILLLKSNKQAPSSVAAHGATEDVLRPEILESVFEVSFDSSENNGKQYYFVTFDSSGQG